MTGEYHVLNVPDNRLCQKEYGPTKTNAIHVITVNGYIVAIVVGSSPPLIHFAYCYKTNPNFRNLEAIFRKKIIINSFNND